MKELSLDESFLESVYAAIGDNLGNEQFGVDELAKEVGLSRSQLHRRLSTLINKSASQLIKETRLQRAKELLEGKTGTVSEIAYQVGFSSPSYFNTAFHEHFGFSPGKTPSRPVVTEKRPGFRIAQWVIGSIFLLLVGTFSYFLWGREIEGLSTGGKKSIAVLPFTSLSDDPSNKYFAIGQMDAILNNLAKIHELRVISRNTMDQYVETTKTTPEIARELNVTHILEGSVQQQGNDVRLIMQLIEGESDDHVWSRSFDGDLSDIFKLQSEVALTVAKELSLALSMEEVRKIEFQQTVNLEAYNYYLMGRDFWKRRTKSDLEESIAYFEKALEKDPNYALAYSGLADTYYIMSFWRWMDWNDGTDEAMRYVRKALELNPDLPQANATLGSMLWEVHQDWDSAGQVLQRVVESNPNYPTGHLYFSEYLEIISDHEGGRNHLNRALELDPLAIIHYHVSSMVYFGDGEYQKFLDDFLRARELNPNSKIISYWNAFISCLFLGKEDDAFGFLMERWKRDEAYDRYIDPAKIIFEDYGIDSLFSWATDVEASLNPRYMMIARNYAIQGDLESSIFWLRKGYEDRSRVIAKAQNFIQFKPLWTDKRYIELMRKTGLTKEESARLRLKVKSY